MKGDYMAKKRKSKLKKKRKSAKTYRSAVTGRIITRAAAECDPRQTYASRRKKKR